MSSTSNEALARRQTRRAYQHWGHLEPNGPNPSTARRTCHNQVQIDHFSKGLSNFVMMGGVPLVSQLGMPAGDGRRLYYSFQIDIAMCLSVHSVYEEGPCMSVRRFWKRRVNAARSLAFQQDVATRLCLCLFGLGKRQARLDWSVVSLGASVCTPNWPVGKVARCSSAPTQARQDFGA